MLALKSIYKNGTIILDRPLKIEKPINVIVTFIDEEIQVNYQIIDKAWKRNL